VTDVRKKIATSDERISKIDDLQKDYNISEMKQRQTAERSLESSIAVLKHAYDREVVTLNHQTRSLRLLDEVPCGDTFPTCKFIKDAHSNKKLSEKQTKVVESSKEELDKAKEALEVFKSDDIHQNVIKLEKLRELRAKLVEDSSPERVSLITLETKHKSLVQEQQRATDLLRELTTALEKSENQDVVKLRVQIDELTKQVSARETLRLNKASKIGQIKSDNEKLVSERDQREQVLQKMKAHDLIETALSKRAVPAMIVSSQLPMINAEIAKILQGIVDFTVELVVDETDDLEIFINYGDSQRIIELCSGMEKVIASIAIRVALINVSSLPKANFFVIDESFGPLDETNVEACSRLLVSLKRYFRTILLITHIDVLKDVADRLVEISQHEKDAKISYGTRRVEALPTK
jgi:DNA repair exonuclease SbcCD ATPase subunit